MWKFILVRILDIFINSRTFNEHEKKIYFFLFSQEIFKIRKTNHAPRIDYAQFPTQKC